MIDEKAKQATKEHGSIIAKTVGIAILLLGGLALITTGGWLMTQPDDTMVFIGTLLIVTAFAAWARTLWVVVMRSPRLMRDDLAEWRRAAHERAMREEEELREERRQEEEARRVAEEYERRARSARAQEEFERGIVVENDDKKGGEN